MQTHWLIDMYSVYNVYTIGIDAYDVKLNVHDIQMHHITCVSYFIYIYIYAIYNVLIRYTNNIKLYM